MLTRRATLASLGAGLAAAGLATPAIAHAQPDPAAGRAGQPAAVSAGVASAEGSSPYCPPAAQQARASLAVHCSLPAVSPHIALLGMPRSHFQAWCCLDIKACSLEIDGCCALNDHVHVAVLPTLLDAGATGAVGCQHARAPGSRHGMAPQHGGRPSVLATR